MAVLLGGAFVGAGVEVFGGGYALLGVVVEELGTGD
jgi:hypothetical protein